MATKYYKSLTSAKREATRQRNRYGLDVEAVGNPADGYSIEPAVRNSGKVKIGSLKNI